MVSLKCKSCGDTIIFEDNAESAICPSCGNLYVPPVDEKREEYLNLYSRADDAWDHKDFEEAAEIYQRILDIDNTQAEAHFGLVLCKYGITYEIDPITQKKMPTCNRINRDSILDDKHFQTAMKYASKKSADSFKQRAEEIDRISRDFLKIVDKEPPYDVFISYKRTGADGEVTQDSKVARKLYFHLKDKGFKIFFAEETLKSVAGEKYEPYIFAALSSAPVMIVIGSRTDYFNATWVKNEWRRYLVLMSQGLKKTLIPVFFDMDPYHMPGELRTLQSMNASDFTFHEDITEIIRKKVADAKDDRGEREVKGQSLRDKYADKVKVDKVVDATDCDREFAINVLISCYGDVEKSKKYIAEDPEYKRNHWVCAECGANNIHEKCHNCGVTKKESIEVARARQKMKEDQEKQSAEYKQQQKARRKKRTSKIITISIIGAVILAAILLLKWLAFLPEDDASAIAVGVGVVGAIIVAIIQLFSGDGFNFWVTAVIAVILGIVMMLICALARWIFIKNVYDFYTPEIVQTYSGSYYADNTHGDGSITITECTEDGKLTGVFEFTVESNYGKYNLEGEIIEKKNNGYVQLKLRPGEWIIQPPDFGKLEEMLIEVNDNYTSFECDTYNMSWTPGYIDEGNAINNASDLKALNDSSATYSLKCDIDLSGENWTPIKNFSGTLIGNGFTIKNLNIESSESNVGLFANLEGIVRNINIENASVTVSGHQENVGILCGTLQGKGTMQNVTVSGNVMAESCKNVGGVAGFVTKEEKQFTINVIENKANVTGNECVGGVFGKFFNDDGWGEGTSISTFTNSGAITGKTSVGGTMGECLISRKLVINNSKNTGTITGEVNVGGIVAFCEGNTESIINGCSNQSAITGEAYVGCIAGKAKNVTINSCTNSGSTLNATKYVTVEGVKYAYVGGFAGSALGANDCVNEVTIEYTAGGAYVGGVVGYVDLNQETVEMKNLENKANISGSDSVGGIFGKLYNNYGWSGGMTTLTGFVNSGKVVGGDNVGGMIGDCVVNASLTITGADNTGTTNGAVNVGGVVGYAKASIGSYIGNSSCVSAISGEAYVGCIAGKAENMEIIACTNAGSNLSATRYVTVDGTKYACVGGFAGYAIGASDCVNEVGINYTAGGAYVGGIIGYVEMNKEAVEIKNLENKAGISGADYVGGIFGKFYNSYGWSGGTTQISDSKNSGKITGKSNVGGLFGECRASEKLYILDLENSATVSGSKNVGGIVGYCKGRKDSYIQDSTTTSGKICGKSEDVTVR